jgi:hypothetical protein
MVLSQPNFFLQEIFIIVNVHCKGKRLLKNINDQLILIQKSIDELKMLLQNNQPNIISDKWISWSV